MKTITKEFTTKLAVGKLLTTFVMLLAFCMMSNIAKAQNAGSYVFSTNATGSLTDMSSGTTTLVAANSDDVASSITTIPFTFNFCGTGYTQFSVNSNGLMRLGSSSVGTSTNTAIGGTASQPLISAFSFDMQTRGTTGKVHYKTINSTPNRILVVEWLNMKIGWNAATGDGVFQVWLYETTNQITFVYGNMVYRYAPSVTTVSAGIQTSNTINNYATIAINNHVVQSGATSNFNLSSLGAVPQTITSLSSAAQGSRRVYNFIPCTASTAPTSISGTAAICQGSSTTLTTAGGTLGSDAVDVWYQGSCGTEAYSQGWVNYPLLPAALTATTITATNNGVMTVTSSSGDPAISMYSPALGSFVPATYRYINVRYKVTAGTAGSCELFFTNTTYAVPTGAGDYLSGALISDGAYHVLSIDCATNNPNWLTGGNITGWRFDWCTNTGVTMDIDFISLSTQPIIGDGTSITVSPTVNTTYYTAKKGSCGLTSCASQLISVTAPPAQPSAITGSTTVCANAADATYSVTNVAGVTYAWTFPIGSGWTGGTTTNSVTGHFTASASGNITVIPTTCAAGPAQTLAVTINPIPTPVITGVSIVCASSTGIVYSVANVVGNTYSWSVTGGTFTGQGTSSIGITPNVGSTSFTVDLTEAITATGCSAAATQMSVTVSPAPAPVITGAASVCNGTTGSVYSTPNVVLHTYVWTVVGGIITAGAGTNSITVTWNVAGPGTVDVTEDVGTCSGAATQKSVTVNPLPTPVITGASSACTGTTGNIYGVTNVVGNSYTWTVVGGSVTAGAGTNSITVTWGAAGPGTVDVTESITATTCSIAATQVAVTINPLPTVAPTATPTTICAGGTSQLHSGDVGNFGVSSITYAPLTAVSPTNLCSGGTANVALTSGTLDDGGWGAIPIGFNYHFLGNDYTTVNVGTNGIMQFGAYNGSGAGGLTDFSIPGYPNVGSPANSIGVMACDLKMSTTGTIRYWTTGVSPSRIFVVDYLACPGFLNGSTTVQCLLYETTGIVEIHVTDNSDTDTKTIGLQDLTQTIGATAPNRNGTNFTLGNEAWRFGPVNSNTFLWSGGPLSNTSIDNPIATPLTPTTYTVTVTNPSTTCQNTGTVLVTVNPLPTPVITGSLTVCTGATGSVYSTPNVAGNSYTWTVVGGIVTAGAGTNSITVTWGPAGPGTVDVTETIIATTCSAAGSQMAVTISALPTPVITGSSSGCTGATGNIYSVTNVAGHAYAWTVVGGTITAGAGTNSITVTWGAAGPGTVDVTETINATTCSAAATQIAVTINSLPTLSANGGGVASICAGSATPAFTNSQGAGVWSITAGTGTASVDGGGIVTGITAGTVSVVYTYDNGTCSNSVSSPLTVNSCCAVPTGLSTTSITNTSATLNWSNTTIADTFRIRYSEMGSGINHWKDVNGTGTWSTTITGLNPNTNYVWQVHSRCLGVSTIYTDSTLGLFTTTNTPEPCVKPYGVTVGSITNFSALISWSNLVISDTFRLRYAVVGSITNQWKDVNGTGTWSTTLSGLLQNTNYKFQISSICSGVSSGYGAVYYFTTTNGVVPCAQPYGLDASGITGTSAVLTWTNLVSADTFRVRYSVNGTTNYLWKDVNGSGGSTATLTGLSPSTTYQYQVSSVCSGIGGHYSASFVFATDNTATSCVKPVGLGASNVNNTSELVSWSNVVTADTFRIRYSVNGTTAYSWKDINGTSTWSTTLTGLTPSTSYQYQVSSICTGVSSGYSASFVFGTPARLAATEEAQFADVLVYPNPSTGRFTIEINSGSGEKMILQIFDAIGQVVYEKEIIANQDEKYLVDISDRAKGVYHLLVSDSQKRMLRKLVVE